jgi:hypothetical protein
MLKINSELHELTCLVDTIPTHRALNNAFYSRWVAKPLPIEKIALFARNYWEFSWHFPEALAGLIANSQNISARVEYTKILYSELGYGNAEKVHTFLFEKFCSDLSSHMGRPGYLSIENLKKNVPLLETTKKLIEGENNLYTHNLAMGAGAQLALECQAYGMISSLYDGARNYATLWPTSSSFHESCEFFYIHIGSVEKEHRKEALAAVNSIAQTDVALIKDAIAGFDQHLKLFADFWETLANEMEKYEQ